MATWLVRRWCALFGASKPLLFRSLSLTAVPCALGATAGSVLSVVTAVSGAGCMRAESASGEGFMGEVFTGQDSRGTSTGDGDCACTGVVCAGAVCNGADCGVDGATG